MKGVVAISAKKRVIVTDVRYRMSLPVIRSLGEKGFHVTCTDLIGTSLSASLGFASKYAASTAYLPSPDNEEEFLTELEKLCGNHKPVIIPVGIDTLLCMCKNADRINRFAETALPSMESFTTANDKNRLMNHAKDIVPCPLTETLCENEDISAFSMRIEYPAVIKYREGELLRLDPKDRYCAVKTKDEFIDKFTKMHKIQQYPLVQEYVEGEGFGVSAVFDKSHNPLAVFCHRRIREYPASGGPSCLCESAWNKELADNAVKLLKSLNWVGVAMVEFKGSPDKGYKLMEINPRFWGSSALAPISGCNIAEALYNAASGIAAAKDVTSAPEYKVGKRMRFFLQDALSLFGYMKMAKNPVTYFFKHMASLLNPLTRGGVFSWQDPKPAFRYLKNALRKADKIIR